MSQQIIKDLEAKVASYEELLREVLGDKKHAGVITAGAHNKIYRVAGNDGTTRFIPANADKKYKIGDSVLTTEKIILEKMPELLEVKKEIPNFKLIDWCEIGGMKSQIQQIRDSVELPLSHAHLYKEFGASPIKGLLLYGAPGCGKTLIAKAIASTILKGIKKPEAESFIYLKGAELLSMYVGATEQAIRKIFDDSRAHFDKKGIRSVVFIDEAEALLPERGSRLSSDVDTTIVPTFLSEMDGFQDNSPFIILSTNKPNSVDTALLREGRIDLKIHIGRPTFSDLTEIFYIHLGKTKVIGDINKLSEEAAYNLLNEEDTKHKISGALAATVVKIAIEFAIKRKIADKSIKSGVTGDDILNSIKKINQHETEAIRN